MKITPLFAFAASLIHEQSEKQTAFALLSQEAQDAIIWAVMSSPGEVPPVLSESVQKEIMEWRDSGN